MTFPCAGERLGTDDVDTGAHQPPGKNANKRRSNTQPSASTRVRHGQCVCGSGDEVRRPFGDSLDGHDSQEGKEEEQHDLEQGQEEERAAGESLVAKLARFMKEESNMQDSSESGSSDELLEDFIGPLAQMVLSCCS